MNKQILLSILLVLGIFSVTAQVTTTGIYTYQDTLRYVDSKTSAYSGIPLGIDQLNGASDDGYVQYAQKFEAPDTVTITGGCFYAVMDFDPSDTVYLMLYDTLASGGPGVTIDSVELIALSLGNGYTGALDNPAIELCGNFTTPIERKGSYYMGMQNQDTTDVFITRNANGNGGAEQLNWMYYKWLTDSQFDGWYSTFSFGAGWNFDFVIRPIVSYDVEMSITLDTALCLGDTLVTTTDLSMEDVVLSNKFYNPNFATYSGLTFSDSADFDNGTGLTNDTSYEYTVGGMYNFTSTAYPTIGWTISNVENSLSDMVTVTDATVDLGADISGCSLDSIVLNAGSGYDFYLWNDASVDSILIIQGSGLSNGVNDFYVDVTLNGCSYRDSIEVVSGNPVVDLGSDTIICLNQSVDLDAGTFESYNWNTGQTSQNITVGPSTSAGDITIVVDVIDGSCSGSDTLVITVDDCLSVNDLESALSIFPNPVQNELNIVVEGLEYASWSYSITDASGKLIINENQMSSYQKVDVSNFESGLYFMTVTSGNTSVVKQISVIK